MIKPCSLIHEQMIRHFQCSEHGKYIRIRTPFMYPDGDFIDLFWDNSNHDDTVTITDLGETVRWLKMQTISMKRSQKQNQLIQDIVLNHGVEFFRGMLQLRVRPGEDVALATIRLAQACVSVSDIWFTFKTRTISSMIDEVDDFLFVRKIAHDRNVNMVGRSGKNWLIPFHTRTARQSSLICVLSTGARGATRRITNQIVATWCDLNPLKAGSNPLHFISLFDDTTDVWNEEDFKQLEDLSEIARWSDTNEFCNLLKDE